MNRSSSLIRGKGLLGKGVMLLVSLATVVTLAQSQPVFAQAQESQVKSTEVTIDSKRNIRDSYEVWINNLTEVKLVKDRLWLGSFESFIGGKYKDSSELAQRLVEKLGSSNSDDVERASYHLGKIMKQGALLALSKGLFHENRQVRANSASVLGFLKPRERKINRDLEAALKDTEPIVRRNAALAIGDIRSLDVGLLFAVNNLADNDPNEEVRRASKWAARQISQVLSFRELIEQLDIEMGPKLESMIETIAAVGTGAIPDLSRVVRDRSESLRKRVNAIVVLSQIRPVVNITIKTFQYAIQSDDFNQGKVDLMAIMIKNNILNSESVQVFEKLLDHQDYLVRAYASGALFKIGSVSKQAEPKLKKMIVDSPYLLERLNAMLALKSLDTLDDKTIKALKHIAATDDDRGVSYVAKEVLDLPGYSTIRLRPFFSSDLPD